VAVLRPALEPATRTRTPGAQVPPALRAEWASKTHQVATAAPTARGAPPEQRALLGERRCMGGEHGGEPRGTGRGAQGGTAR
jgi:hypothetical protein